MRDLLHTPFIMIMWVVLSLDQLGQLVVLQLKGRRRKEPYYLCADSPLQDSTLSWHFTYAREKPGNKATKN